MEQVFSYIISLGASVMMPILFTIIGLCIGMKFGKSLKSGLYVGVGFVGLGIVTALLTNNFGSPLSEISRLYDLQLGVFDMGWPAAAAVAYNTAVRSHSADCRNCWSAGLSQCLSPRNRHPHRDRSSGPCRTSCRCIGR